MKLNKLCIAVAMASLVAGCSSDKKSDSDPVDFYNSDNWQSAFPAQHSSWAETENNTPEDGLIDLLDKNPNLVVAWAGYGFAKDYNQARGHHFAVTDVIKSLRTGHPMMTGDAGEAMAASCWSCKTPDIARLYDEKGENAVSQERWSNWGDEISNTIGCADCHDLGEASVRLSRPYTERAMEMIDRPFAGQEAGEQGNQVCAQCHVEYYFDGTDSNNVKYPWDFWVPGVETDYADKVNYQGNDGLYKGFAAEAQLAYFDAIGFKDWTNAISGVANIKAQHPEYENISDRTSHKMKNHMDFTCIDCHMPQATNDKGQNYSVHNVRFDANKLADNCQMCHDASDFNDMFAERKATITELRFGDNGTDARITELHLTAQAIWSANGIEGLAEGKSIGEAKKNYETALTASNELADDMNKLLTQIRNVQWFWDSATASHGIHAHNPAEAIRLLTKTNELIDIALVDAAALLEKYESDFVFNIDTVNSKEKAQVEAGLNFEKMVADKEKFITERVEKEWPHKLK